MSKYLTTGDVARIFGVDKKTIWTWVQTGKLVPSHKTLGGHLRFHSSEVIKFMSSGARERLLMICEACAAGRHQDCKKCTCQHRTDRDTNSEPVSLLLSPDSGKEISGDRTARIDH